MNDPIRLYLDFTLVAVALFGVVAFILLDRPRMHVALLFFIALLWGIELTIVLSGSTNAPALYARAHPAISFATTVAAIAIVVTRRRNRSKPG
jgi:hypothetical protein